MTGKNLPKTSLDPNITRRDFLNSALLASGGALLSGACPMQFLGQQTADAMAQLGKEWTGYGGVGDYANSNGNVWDVVIAGHQIRNHVYDSLPPDITDTKEVYDLIVVGGGISGLAAAHFFQRKRNGKQRCLVLEDHPVFGGEAKRNEFLVDGQKLIAHQGSTWYQPPLPGTFLSEFYDSVGITARQFEYQRWDGGTPEIPLGPPYFEDGPSGASHSALFFGAKFGHKDGLLVVDPWRTGLIGTPISREDRAGLIRMQTKPIAAPKQDGDALARHLDNITLEQHLMNSYGLSQEAVRTYLLPVSDSYGIGPDVVSGYAEYAYDILLPWDRSKGQQLFPGGNDGVARHITQTLIPDSIPGPHTLASVCQTPINFAALDRAGQPVRIRLNATVVAVQHEGNPRTSQSVRIVYTVGGKLYSVRGRSVVMAGGSWTTRSIVRDLPDAQRDAYGQFFRSPAMVANVAVRNWRFLSKLGLSECKWFDGIGTNLAVHKDAIFGGVSPTISPDLPTVLTLKILFCHPGLPLQDQTMRGRYELLSTSFRDYEQRIAEQLTSMFSRSGFDAHRDVAGIILNRWGHAYLSPQPGFFFGKNGKPAPREVLRSAPFGRIAFANTDLAGIMDHCASIQEAHRAIGQIMEIAKA
jgi:spermidine dehydrogenase